MMKLRTIREIIKVAEKKIKPNAFKWINGAAEFGNTCDRNRDIFRQIGIVPRVLNNNKNIHISKNFFGRKCSAPILFSPLGGTDQFNKKSEFIFSEIAEKNKIPYFFPNNSGHTIREINPLKKKQFLNRSMYLDNDLNFCKREISDAEKNGCHSITITVDSPVRPVSYNKIDQNYDARKHYATKPLNYFRKKKGKPLTWNVISKIRKMTKKPIILKGILSKHDALRAYNLGMDGIWISNHGGRILESDVTAVEVLSEIREKLPKKVTVICDGGIRTGTDILKTISLGADFVSIGRPLIYGLIANSKEGVNKVIELLKFEFLNSMKLAGTSNFDDIKKLKKILRFYNESR